MQLKLTENEARTLRAMLEAHLPDIRREAARERPGEARDLLRSLIARRELCERLIHELDSALTPAL